jgi:hypothetical protein
VTPDTDPATLTDAALRDELAQLEATSADAATPEDDLTERGYARLYALQAEQGTRMARLRAALGAALQAEYERVCPCCTRPAPGLAPGTICAACAAWPLD